jgi:hypothetical protein
MVSDGYSRQLSCYLNVPMLAGAIALTHLSFEQQNRQSFERITLTRTSMTNLRKKTISMTADGIAVHRRSWKEV